MAQLDQLAARVANMEANNDDEEEHEDDEQQVDVDE